MLCGSSPPLPPWVIVTVSPRESERVCGGVGRSLQLQVREIKGTHARGQQGRKRNSNCEHRQAHGHLNFVLTL